MMRGDKRSMPKAKAMTLADFQYAFRNLGWQYWIPSKSKGPTGIDQTLEHALGLKEKTIVSPDLGKVEIKAYRIESPSLITLFTFNHKVWRMKPSDAVYKYGVPNKKGDMGLYGIVSRTPNSVGLFLDVSAHKISLRHIRGDLIADWYIKNLIERFKQKIPALIWVDAVSEMRGDVEWFNYGLAHLLKGTSVDIISCEAWANHILFDIRLTERTSLNESRLLADSNHLDRLFRESTTL